MFVPRWILQAAFAVAAVAAGWLLQSAFAAEPPTAAYGDDRIVAAHTQPFDQSGQVAQPDQGAATSNGQPIALTVRVVMPDDAKSSGKTSVTTGTGQTVTYPSQSSSGQSLTQSSAATAKKTAKAPPKKVTNKRTTNTRTTTTTTMGTAAYGNNIVIARDGSIVLVGDGADLNANTGNAQQGGAIGVDTNDSDLSTGVNRSGPSLRASSSGSPTSHTPARSSKSSLTGTSTTTTPTTTSTAKLTTASTAKATTGTTAFGSPPGQAALTQQNVWVTRAAAAPVLNPVIATPFGHGGTVDIAGYEDHSVLVWGDRNIATYDDSNVFVNRDGLINANTGDTDSSGLNAVDTFNSYIRSGDHCDDGCDDESIIGALNGHYDSGDDDDEDSDSDDGDTPDPDEPDEPDQDDDDEGLRRTSQRTATATTTTPAAPYVRIGGDGYDNISLHVFGNDNIVTDDDSNVVVGGTGKVNAQIGDSDTGGTVAMSTYNSVVLGGVSR